MHIPSYLTTSRHNVYYFRWPIPKSLHPQNKYSDIKLSLQTRDCNEALQLSRIFAYMAQPLCAKMKASNMRYEDMRSLLQSFFSERLKNLKARIGNEGRLNESNIQHFKNGITDIDDDDFTILTSYKERHPVHDVIDKHELAIKEDTTEYEQLKEEYKNYFKAFCHSVLDYDASFDNYEVGVPQAAHQRLTTSSFRTKGIPLGELIEKYCSDRITGQNWTRSTEKEYRAIYAFLCEILDKSHPCTDIDIETARDVKETITKVPKNLRTSPKTRDLSLSEALLLTGIPTMHVTTINKHLAAFNGLFNWAEKNGYVEKNVFSGLTVRAGKKAASNRKPFSNEQIIALINELVVNPTGFIKKEYQRWGPLIGIYTGARLNEIAQLQLTDIKQEDGIWCFDFNDEDDEKGLKTEASRRFVPIHSELINLGLLKHVETLRQSNKKRLLHELSRSPRNGYGRNLGRWFNNSLLPHLDMKQPHWVFHSLRHGMTTNLLQSGVEEPIAKSVIGHAQDGVIQRTYSQGYTVKQKQEALEKLSWQITTASNNESQ